MKKFEAKEDSYEAERKTAGGERGGGGAPTRDNYGYG